MPLFRGVFGVLVIMFMYKHLYYLLNPLPNDEYYEFADVIITAIEIHQVRERARNLARNLKPNMSAQQTN